MGRKRARLAVMVQEIEEPGQAGTAADDKLARKQAQRAKRARLQAGQPAAAGGDGGADAAAAAPPREAASKRLYAASAAAAAAAGSERKPEARPHTQLFDKVLRSLG